MAAIFTNSSSRFLGSGKGRRKSEDVARELTNAEPLVILVNSFAYEKPISRKGKSDFHRLRQGLPDNLSNAAYAKCASAADAPALATIECAIT
ncbi:MAG TPA: hypothetical protein VJS47_03755 [Rhizomicrobium sp.]|nr:hypothetical protein [Rhizomicrobium sp.]